MRAVIRSYRVLVLLGQPNRHLWRILFRLHRHTKIAWLTPRFPLIAKLLGISYVLFPNDQASLLRELSRFADTHEGKMLTLLPTSPDMADFTNQNRSFLEENYCIRSLSDFGLPI